MKRIIQIILSVIAAGFLANVLFLLSNEPEKPQRAPDSISDGAWLSKEHAPPKGSFSDYILGNESDDNGKKIVRPVDPRIKEYERWEKSVSRCIVILAGSFIVALIAWHPFFWQAGASAYQTIGKHTKVPQGWIWYRSRILIIGMATTAFLAAWYVAADDPPPLVGSLVLIWSVVGTCLLVRARLAHQRKQ